MPGLNSRPSPLPPGPCPPCRSPLRYASVLTDVVQAAIGCANHHRTAPSHHGIGPMAAVAYLPFGSTALWMYCYTAFSFLPFHLELLKAGLVCTVLVVNSSSLCRRSPGLLAGYAALRSVFLGVLRQLHAMVPLAALRPASVLPAMASIADSTPPAEQLASSASCSSRWHFWPPPCQPAQQCPPGDARQAVCVQSQLVVVLLAFVGSTWAVHHSQLQARLHFLHRCCAQVRNAPLNNGAQQQQQQQVASGQEQQGQHGQQASTDLHTSAAYELVGPLPNSADFLSLAVPAALCTIFALHLPWRGDTLE